jgi:MoaA/NifB/PqqE/SkfB family radical SAM enzyme
MINKLFFLVKKNPHYLPFLGLNYFREKVSDRLFSKSGISPFPSLITIMITKRCNYKCPGCCSGSPLYTKNFKGKEKEITLSEIKKIVDEVSFFKPFIYLNGGEPTLRGDLVEIINYVKSKKLICALTTNGSFLNSKLSEQLVKVKLDFLSVSIDGPKQFHDRMRGVSGAFEKAVLGVKNIKFLKEKYKASYPHVRLASIVYPENLENTKYIIDLANESRVDELGFGLLMYYPQKIINMQKKFISENKTGGEEPIGFQINNNSKFDFSEKEYFEVLSYSRKSKIPVFFAYQGNQYQEYFDPSIFPSKKSFCLTPWNNLLIHPNGDLGICQGFKFGSIHNGSILSQWNNKEIIKFRKKRAEEPLPACFRCNEGQKVKFDK